MMAATAARVAAALTSTFGLLPGSRSQAIARLSARLQFRSAKRG